MNLMKAADYIRDGDAIYARSFQIIRAEADLTGFSKTEAELAVRMIHACGAVELAKVIEFSADFASRGRAALRQGAPIFCDAQMVVHGITKARLPAGNDVICTLRDPRTPELAAKLKTTRSAAALNLWGSVKGEQHRADENDDDNNNNNVNGRGLAGAVVAIGNAPTALFHLLDMIASGAPKPAVIIGMPVGFVGAAESKDALAAAQYDIAYAIIRGRLGGSAITAACVNALAKSGI